MKTFVIVLSGPHGRYMSHNAITMLPLSTHNTCGEIRKIVILSTPMNVPFEITHSFHIRMGFNIHVFIVLCFSGELFFI